MSSAADAVARLLGGTITSTRPLASGLSLVTVDGTPVVVKPAAGPNATAAEAAGLRWLGDSGDVAVPRVYGYDDDWLVTEYVPPGRATPAAAEAAGRGLAAVHRCGAPAFGAAPPDGPIDAWIGSARMRNVGTDSWPEFYVEHRVLPYVREAVDSGSLPVEQAAVIEDACAVVADVAPPEEPPARLHGDLWSGNLHAGADRIWLLDPAAHGGHAETDLAMLQLFRAPHLEHLLGGYAEAAADAGAPLADGWRDRVDLHQLFPLLVHTVLFGGGYAQRAVAAARRTRALR